MYLEDALVGDKKPLELQVDVVNFSNHKFTSYSNTKLITRKLLTKLLCSGSDYWSHQCGVLLTFINKPENVA